MDEAAYPHNYEVGCAVCSYTESEGSTYSRWGHRECPSGVTTLYSGYMSSSHYNHPGGGYNTLCLHPQGQLPAGAHGGNQNGNLLYGMEYQSTHDGLEQLTPTLRFTTDLRVPSSQIRAPPISATTSTPRAPFACAPSRVRPTCSGAGSSAPTDTSRSTTAW